jgi:arylsulfatase A-like enzyme
MKGDAWEGGHRVPFVARWPGRIRPGTVNAATISLVDLLATFAALVGRKLPASAGEDSFDLLPLLREKSATLPREATIALSARGTPAIRHGRWKLIPALGSRGLSEPRLLEPENGQPTGQLYDLAADPGETMNLWAERPEVVARLQAVFEKYRDAGRSRSHE